MSDPAPDPATPPLRGGPLSVVALLLLGLAFHLPRLDKPLGIADSNAGAFIGVFLHNWEDHGFADLRGVPLWRQRVFAPNDAVAEPYVKHPPGLFWACFALGSAEWAMRLPSMLGAILASVSLCFLLRPRLGAAAALAAGACLLGTPSLALYSQASYETVSLGMGLLLWLAVERRWHVVAALTAFAGTWLDWSFGMFCLGLVPLTASRSLRTWGARLLLPALATIAAVLTILAWQTWALRGEHLNAQAVAALRQDGLGALLRTTILERPPLASFVAGVLHFVPTTAGPAVALIAVAGVFRLARLAPKLTAALAIAGAHFIVFGGHGVDHPHFYCFQTALVAAAAAAMATLPLPRPARAAIATAVIVAAWISGVRATQHSDTTFMRDLGLTLTAAADAASPTPTNVATNCWPVFAYYVGTPHVYVLPVLDAEMLRRHSKTAGFRYLWFKTVEFGPGHNPDNPHLRPDAARDAFLGAFPSQRIEVLEGRIVEPAYRLDMDIREVRLITVPRSE